MAQKVQILLVDDLDGTEATETIEFAIDGVGYEIDLHDDNAQKMRDALAPYVAEARKSTPARRRGGARSTAPRRAAAGGPSAAEVRDWAREQGMEVSERGRVSSQVREAYDAAH